MLYGYLALLATVALAVTPLVAVYGGGVDWTREIRAAWEGRKNGDASNGGR